MPGLHDVALTTDNTRSRSRNLGKGLLVSWEGFGKDLGRGITPPAEGLGTVPLDI